MSVRSGGAGRRQRFFPGAEQVVCEQMRECDFGLFEGKNYQELTGNPKYQSWIDSGGTKAFPGGEDPMEFGNGVSADLNR